ncbi:MAG TPA: IS110 family transposase [Salinimicrobium catena]|uniref:IS110 family transposase n=1 Tax=Salinimicrobium catena TaxID=390640 RepID=A0A7C2MI32_9FLAO|nr:IS110 family transposase [Salinimicrobium catena]
MQVPFKQSIGVDVAKETFTACLCQQDIEGFCRLSQVEEFKNTKTGFNKLIKWFRKIAAPKVPVVFVMEATGNHYENLAHHLYGLKQQVSVLLPNTVTHYAKSLNVKSKTDAIDARVIAQLGVERKLTQWVAPRPIFKQLKALTRLYSQLQKEKTVFTNRQDSLKTGYQPQRFVLDSNKTVINTLNQQIKKCEREIEKLVKSDQWLWSKIKKIMTTKGLGITTIAVVVAETQGFEFVQNIRQLTSYAGFDVVRRESGTSVKGKTRISKKGNSRIRAALYFPALVAVQHNKDLSKAYYRIIEGKPSKMVGITALQRKLLILIYTLWKNDQEYQDNYLNTVKKKAGRDNPSLPAQDELIPDRTELSFVV